MVATATIASGEEGTDTDSLIVLNRELHFTGGDGGDVPAPLGQYSVEAGPEEHPSIRLRNGTDALVVPATRLSHDETVVHPTSLLVLDGDDRLHVVLLIPGGAALDAIGYFDAVRPRDVNVRATQLRSDAFKQALQQKTTSQGLAGPISQVSPAVLVEMQKMAAQAKAEMEPAAMLIRIKALEAVIRCLVIEGYGKTYGPASPPPIVYPANRADVSWDGIKCPGR